VRVPTRLERDIAVDATDPAGNPVFRLLGNDDFESEELLAYEAGYRWRPLEAFFVDVAAFYNRYEGLASLEFGTPFVDPTDGRTIVPIVNRNLTDGDSEGIEALISYSPVPHWRLSATYSYLNLNLDPRGDDLNRGQSYEGATPKHQVGLRSLLDLPRGIQLDMHFRYLDDVRQAPEIATGEGVDGYSELDVRLAWQAWKQLEVSVVGQNLLHRRHAEWGAPDARGAIERTVYAKAAWGF
jgi:iron complex outermembrane receptor protein